LNRHATHIIIGRWTAVRTEMHQILTFRTVVLAGIALGVVAPTSFESLCGGSGEVLAELAEVASQEPLLYAQQDSRRELLRLEESADAMGVAYTVVLYGYDMDRMRTAAQMALEEVQRVDRMLSKYRAESEVSRVNRDAADHPVKVSPEFFALLSECLRYSRESEGAFDITVGPLMKVWGFYRGTGRLARREQVAQALRKVGYRNVLLDAANCAVRFSRRGVELDFGGIGKGYAVDRMVCVLKDQGIGSALVNGGGSSIYALGSPAKADRGWEINILDPKDPSKIVTSALLKNESLSTSGNYKKFFLAEGRLYSHIMDPRTGFPAEGVLEVSVIAPRTLDSEVWTKPCFILGRDWTLRHKPPGFRVLLCEDRPGQTCAWLE
jgi:thiamine biosynthesis lipoprotein